jgi:hypothetical protein
MIAWSIHFSSVGERHKYAVSDFPVGLRHFCLQSRRAEMRTLLISALAVSGTLSGASVACADVVTDWNATAVTAVQAFGPSTPIQARALTIVHLAMFDALNAIDRRYESYAAPLQAPPGASPDAAAATAAHEVLVRMIPLQKSVLDAALAESLKGAAEGPAKQDGVALGRQAAERVLAMRGDDGADRKVEYTPGHSPAAWKPTPPDFQAAGLPQWPQVKPFVIPSVDKFPVPGPHAVDGAAYARDIEEVRIKGGARAVSRTSEQAAVAIFWTVPTAIPWNAAARAGLAGRKGSPVDNARVLALLNMATADSQIGVWTLKYRYNILRPVTAIRDPRGLNNPAINADATWESFIVTPAHPDYVSGHSGYSGAAQAVLTALMGDETKISVTYPQNGLTRHWERFSQIAKEVEDARAWGGIHTRTADEHATELGRQIGAFVAANALAKLK